MFYVNSFLQIYLFVLKLRVVFLFQHIQIFRKFRYYITNALYTEKLIWNSGFI